MSRKKKNRPDRAANVVRTESATLEAPANIGRWYLRTWFLAFLGSLLFFFSFSPHGLSAFGWIATIPFLILVRQKSLSGKRPYRMIWFMASLGWLALLEGIRRPFWALYFGWFALSIYAAAYIPLFIGASRILVHRARWPLAVAAPVIWSGLELARGYLFSGFSVGLLAHTQFQNPLVIQIADLFGQCGVSFLVIAPAAAVVGLLPRSWIEGRPRLRFGLGMEEGEIRESRAPRVICAVAAALLVIASLAYGSHRVQETDEIAKGAETLQIALIQGNVDVVFGGDSSEYVFRQWRQCLDLTDQVRDRSPHVSLVVWPESCFSGGEFDMQVIGPLKIPAGSSGTPEQMEQYLKERYAEPFVEKCLRFAQRFNAPGGGEATAKAKFLGGTGSVEVGPGDKEASYNSAVFIDESGKIESRYYKMHRVMFGEYIPIVDLFPVLYQYTPLPAGIRAGDKPVALRVNDWVLCPNICFESTVPHLIRRQSHHLAAEGAPVDAFVNITNDGWFWGSGVQDLHLHCAIFRAIENRRAFVVAANSGFSVHCDAAGRIRTVGKRRTAEVLEVTISKDKRNSYYYLWGDWPVSNCLLAALAAFVFDFILRRGWHRHLMGD